MTRPNIVLIVADDMPGDAVEDAMPYLGSNPQGNWVMFANGFVQTPVCSPSRTTVLTGRFTGNHGVTVNGQASNIDVTRTLAVALKRAGYHTGLVGKTLNQPASVTANGRRWPGFDTWQAFRYDPPDYYDYTWVDEDTEVQFGSTDADYSTDVIAGKAEAFIEAAHSPFFLYVAPWSPHLGGNTAASATRHASLYTGATPPRRGDFNPTTMVGMPSWYPSERVSTTGSEDNSRITQWRALASVDEMLETLIDALVAKGELDNTIFAFCTDNGYSHRDRRINAKGTPTRVCLDAQLRIRWPGAAQQSTDALVTLADLAPTFAEVAKAPLLTAADGMSLRPLIEGDIAEENWRDAVLLQGYAYAQNPAPTWESIRTLTHQFTRYPSTGESELYDFTTDPWALTNIVTTDVSQAATMAIQLDALLTG